MATTPTATTDQSIDWDAIRAAEEAKRLVWEAETVASEYGFTIAQMRQAFDRVADASNWKLPIDCCPIAVADMPLISEAIKHFTGSEAQFSMRADGWRVRAAGYYEAIGA